MAHVPMDVSRESQRSANTLEVEKSAGTFIRVPSWEAGMAQWWEHSPPTDMARDWFSSSTQYVGWVCCWFSSLLREVFLRVLRFSPLLKNQHFQILIWSRFKWTNSHYVEVPLQIPILFYSILISPGMIMSCSHKVLTHMLVSVDFCLCVWRSLLDGRFLHTFTPL